MRNFYSLFLLLFHCALCITHVAFSQSPLVKKWDSRFGADTSEKLTCLIETTDGGYLLGGYSHSGISGDKTEAARGSADYWIVKTDSNGVKQWDKRFGGAAYDGLNSIRQTTDGGYIIGGFSYSGASGDRTEPNWDGTGITGDFWILKLDAFGNKQWDRRYGGTEHETLTELVQTTDGGYMLAGSSGSGISGDKTQVNRGNSDYWIVKINAMGVKQWDKCFGGSAGDVLYCMRQTADKGYILGGTSTSPSSGDKTQGSKGGYDYWIIKLDSTGNPQWDRDLGGTGDDALYSIQQTTDGGYILGGYSASANSGDKTQPNKGGLDFWIIKVNSLGLMVWDKDFGGDQDEFGFGNIFQTKDKGYFLAGGSFSPISGDKTESNLGQRQTWTVKMDSLGIKQWDKTLFTPGEDEIGYALQNKDGCFVVANYTNGGVGGYKSQSSRGYYDYWLITLCDSTLAPRPVASFSASASIICAEGGQCLSFFDNSTNSPTAWEWLFPGAYPDTSTRQNPTNICYTIPGTYPVTLIVSNGGGTDTLTISPMVNFGGTPAQPVITRHGDTLICSPAAHYQWYFNAIPIFGATDSFYVANQPGVYAVQITDDLGCNSLSDGVSVGIDELSGWSGVLDIYPNPATETFSVYPVTGGGGGNSASVAPNFKAGASLEVYNVFGEKVFSRQPQNDGKPETVNCKNFAAGVYFVHLINNKGRWIGKVVKQ